MIFGLSAKTNAEQENPHNLLDKHSTPELRLSADASGETQFDLPNPATIGAQVFNLFNHPNFGLPDQQITDPRFGQNFYLEQPPTTVLGSGIGANASQRMIQLRGQIRF